MEFRNEGNATVINHPARVMDRSVIYPYDTIGVPYPLNTGSQIKSGMTTIKMEIDAMEIMGNYLT